MTSRVASGVTSRDCQTGAAGGDHQGSTILIAKPHQCVRDLLPLVRHQYPRHGRSSRLGQQLFQQIAAAILPLAADGPCR